MKKLRDETQILDQDFRKSIIEEIRGRENIERKIREQRKHEVYKDRTSKWVIKDLEKEFVGETVKRMINRAANISLLRKVVNKRARTYASGVERVIQDDAIKEMIELYYSRVDMDMVYRKADRYLDLFRNTMIYTVPVKDSIESLKQGVDVYKIENRVLAPYNYDVIPDHSNPTEPRVVILSEFVDDDKGQPMTNGDAFKTSQGYRTHGASQSFRRGDGKDQLIAESPEDDDTDESLRFIWWSHQYHFTTDSKGKIIAEDSPEDNANPIEMLPFTNISTDQEGSFWAEGGDDLVDGAVLIAKKITDMFTIASIQGWGQPIASGKNLPNTIAGGPDKLIAFEYDEGEPKPDFQYVSSSPPIDLWMKMVEQYTALWLTTNDLAPSTVSSSLSATDFPSGIAQVVENAKHVGSLDEKQAIFKDVEPNVLERNRKWHELYFEKKLLNKDLYEITPWGEIDLNIQFHASEELQTEEQRLKNMETRQKLGIISELEMIKRDRGLETDEEAEQILFKIKEEKLSKMSAFGVPRPDTQQNQDSQSQDDQMASDTEGDDETQTQEEQDIADDENN